MIRALVGAPALRLLRSSRTWLFVLGWCALGSALAWRARASGAVHGTDRVLLEAFGPFVVPLLAYGIAAGLVGARSLAASVAPVVAFGAPPARAAFATIAVGLVAGAATTAVLAAPVVGLSHGSADPPLGADLLTTVYAAALGGAAYAAWFFLGATVGARGGGRAAFLLLDWVLGSAGGVAELVTPRAHLRNLLGGAPPMDTPERASAWALVGIVAVCAALAARRARGVTLTSRAEAPIP